MNISPDGDKPTWKRLSEIAYNIHEAKQRGDDVSTVYKLIHEAHDLLVKLGHSAKNPLEKSTVSNLLVPLINMLSEMVKKGVGSWNFLDNYYHAKSFAIQK